MVEKIDFKQMKDYNEANELAKLILLGIALFFAVGMYFLGPIGTLARIILTTLIVGPAISVFKFYLAFRLKRYSPNEKEMDQIYLISGFLVLAFAIYGYFQDSGNFSNATNDVYFGMGIGLIKEYISKNKFIQVRTKED
ncbi:MAG: hypothetical protein AABX01_02940 [Candidatus Micrarchaeota archaeon]